MYIFSTQNLLSTWKGTLKSRWRSVITTFKVILMWLSGMRNPQVFQVFLLSLWRRNITIFYFQFSFSLSLSCLDCWNNIFWRSDIAFWHNPCPPCHTLSSFWSMPFSLGEWHTFWTALWLFVWYVTWIGWLCCNV